MQWVYLSKVSTLCLIQFNLKHAYSFRSWAPHFGCAMLTCTVNYRQHKQPFIFHYNVEDNFGEYYCDICKEERVQKHYFYYCDECSYPAHPRCIFEEFIDFKDGDFRNIKLGRALTHPQSTNIPSLLFIRLRTTLMWQMWWPFQCSLMVFEINLKVT